MCSIYENEFAVYWYKEFSVVLKSFVITSPAGAAAKYCDEYVCLCVCVCLSVYQYISGTTCTIFTNFLCMLPMAMTRSSSCRVTKSHREGAVLRFSFPLKMHCNVLDANNVMQQQTGPFHRCQGVMGVHRQCGRSVIYNCLKVL